MSKFIIDTDTGSDDAVALIMALRDPACEVLAITTVAGNCDLETATRNALISLEMAEVPPVPVYKGLARPLVREQIDAVDVHGQDGLGDVGYPDPHLKAEEEHAINALIRIARTESEPIRLITLGPLTNIALALRKAPDITAKIAHITLMGGAQLGYAAYTEVAEFNIYSDPEAADIVFKSGIPITMVPLEVCLKGDGSPQADTLLSEEEIRNLRAIGTRRAEFAIDCNKTLIDFCTRLNGTRSLLLPDPTAITVALKPQAVLKQYTANVTVDLAGELTYGQTVVNVRGGTALDNQVIRHNATIVAALDGQAFKAHLAACLK